MKARVLIRPKEGILDPQGKAVERALPALGFEGVTDVRVGRLVELEADDPAGLESLCEKLLANPLIEDFEVQLDDGNGENGTSVEADPAEEKAESAEDDDEAEAPGAEPEAEDGPERGDTEERPAIPGPTAGRSRDFDLNVEDEDDLDDEPDDDRE